MKKLVSVIVPVYKVEKYIDQCIKSIVEQSYRNLEIILVDDGSPDRCPELCDLWLDKDPRIKVIHKENGGLSDARNAGIKIATGDFIIFIDSDDYWNDSEAISSIMEKMKEHDYDFVNFHYQKYFEYSDQFQTCFGKVNEEEFGELSPSARKRRMVEQHQYIASACNKIIKRDFLLANKLFFKKGIIGEDMDWCARLLLYAQDVGVFNDDFYVYVQRENSISHAVKYQNLLDVSNNIKRCIYYLKKVEVDGKTREAYLNYVSYVYGTFFVCYYMVKDARKKELLQEMKRYRALLKYHDSSKVKLLYYADRFLSFYGMMGIVYIYSKIRK